MAKDDNVELSQTSANGKKKGKKKSGHKKTVSKASVKSSMDLLEKNAAVLGDSSSAGAINVNAVTNLEEIKQKIYESDIQRFKDLYAQLQNVIATSENLPRKKEKKFKKVVKMLEKRLEAAGEVVKKDYKVMKEHQKRAAEEHLDKKVEHDGEEKDALHVVAFLLDEFGEGEKKLERLETMYEKEPEGCFKYGHLLEVPKLQQYFKDGGKTIVRADEERKVGWVELFFDLIFVVALAHLGVDLEHGRNGKAVSTYAVLFAAVWNIWASCTKYANRIGPRDAFHKILYMVEMVAVLGMVAHTVNGVVGAYIIGRLGVEVFTWWSAYFNPPMRGTAVMQSLVLFLSLAPWVISLFPEQSENTKKEPDNIHLEYWAAGLVIEMVGQALISVSARFSLPYNVEHLAERMGLFTIIMLGENMVALLFDSFNAVSKTYFCAVLAGLLAWNFQTLYFDVEAGRHKQHALVGSKTRGWFWYTSHILLHASIVATAAGSKLIIHSTLEGVNLLTDEEIHHYKDTTFERWLFCGATSTSYFIFSILGLTHKAHHDVLIRKKYRVAARLTIALLMALMPAYLDDNISLTAYMALVAFLSTLTTIIELYGGIAPEEERVLTKKRMEENEEELEEAFATGDTIASNKLA